MFWKKLSLKQRFWLGLGLGSLVLMVVGLSLIKHSPAEQSPAQALNPIENQADVTNLMALSDDAFEQAEVEIIAEFAAGETDDPFARDRWFWEQRAAPADKIPLETYRAAVQAELNRRTPQVAPLNNWQNLGPAPLNDITYGGDSYQDASGRMLSVVVHPNDPNTIFIGAAQGGIWKSTNYGQSFYPVSEHLPSLAIKVIRFAPSNPNIMYAGTGEPHSSTSIYGQGVLKSTDGGETWVHLPSQGTGWNFEYASVSGLQVHPSDPNTLYVTTAAIGTSINHFNPASAPPTGIFKSTDGGQTWTLVKAATNYDVTVSRSLDSNIGFMDLEMAQSNPNLLYASEYLGGVWKSTDAGSTWNLITPQHGNGNGGILPAAVNDFTYFSSGQGLFYPVERFTISEVTGVSQPEFSRIELGLAQSDPNVLYAGYAIDFLLLDGDYDGSFGSQDDIQTPVGLMFKTTDGGATWTWLQDWGRGGAPDYCGTQCSYDNTVEVNPTNANDVLIGGNANYNSFWPVPVRAINTTADYPDYFVTLPWRGMTYRSLDGGNTWIDIVPHCTNIVNSGQVFLDRPVYNCNAFDPRRVMHPDVHGATYDPHSPNRLYVATDGGLHRANISGSGANSFDYLWDNVNTSLSTLQFYDFDAHPTNPNIIIGGLQDNSVAYWDGSSWEGWGFGDGIFGAIDPNSPNYVYMGTQFNIHRHDSGGSKFALNPDGSAGGGWNLGIFTQNDIAQGDSIPFVVPFEIDPVQGNNIYAASAGGRDVLAGLYHSANRGESWTRISQVTGEGRPTSISVSPVNNNYVWYGAGDGYVYLYNRSTAQTARLGSTLPSRYLTRIEASPNDANTVYVTYSGYNSNTFTPGKVFKSTDLGQTWQNISGNLPDIPVSAIAIDPANENRIWVGSDVGVYQTEDGGTSWQSYRGNMPVVAIMDMVYNSTTKYLMASTHGRGMWRVYAGPSAQLTPNTGRPGSRFVVEGRAFTPNSTANISVNETNVGSVNVTAQGGFVFTLQTDAAASDGAYPVSVTQGSNASSLSYRLDSAASLQTAASGDTITVPTSVSGLTEALYLPLILRNFDPTFPQIPPPPTATPDGSQPTATPTPTTPPGADTPTPTPTTPPSADTPTPTPTTPPSSGDPLINGDFEQGNGVGWTESSTNGFTLYGTAAEMGVTFPFAPNGGSAMAWLGRADNETSIIAQTITVPNDGMHYIYYSYQLQSDDICGWDFAYLKVDNNIIATGNLCSSNNISVWTAAGFDLSAYAGQSVSLSFEATTDFSTSSSFFVDDVYFSSTPPTRHSEASFWQLGPNTSEPPASKE